VKEYLLQIKLISYLKSKNLSKIRFFHVPNGGIRSKRQKLLLSSMGLKAGCPDIILEFKGGHIVYLELKTATGSLSKSQKLWYQISNALKTPHYILKGDLNKMKKDLDKILSKHYN